MNVFFLDRQPIVAARMIDDVRCAKMVLETAQLLCMAYPESRVPYKRNKSQYNNPYAMWARATPENYDWLCEYGFHLSDEYTYRFGRIHKSFDVIRLCNDNKHSIIFCDHGFFDPPMPDKYLQDDPVKAYREYYVNEKSNARWNKRRSPPHWWRRS